MRFSQAYYTSCRTGHGSGPGFQTKAITKGVPMEVLRLLEAHVGGYRLPAGRDRRTEEGQPVSFKSFSLGRDLWCVSLTNYKKFDWTGEGIGNLFAHSLIGSRDEFVATGADPFALYHSVCFMDADTGTALDLPPLTLTPGPRDLRATIERLRNRVGGKETLAALLNALLLSGEAARPVVIVADPTDVLYIIEGLFDILPVPIRAGISFSTFEGSKPPVRITKPQIPGATNVLTISGTTGLKAGGQSYSDIEFHRRYCIFDYECRRFSSVLPSSAFAEWASSKVFDADDRALDECLRYLSSCKVTPLNLDSALMSFRQPTAALPQAAERSDTLHRDRPSATTSTPSAAVHAVPTHSEEPPDPARSQVDADQKAMIECLFLGDRAQDDRAQRVLVTMLWRWSPERVRAALSPTVAAQWTQREISGRTFTRRVCEDGGILKRLFEVFGRESQVVPILIKCLDKYYGNWFLRL